MDTLLYSLVALISRIHNYILTLNDQGNGGFTDKELHLIVFGCLGVALILILHPIFLRLSKKGHVMVVSFLYVFTVILVLTFAIEIEQRITGTGAMEFDDVAYGIAGFLIFFAVFLIIRAIVHLIVRFIRNKRNDYYYE